MKRVLSAPFLLLICILTLENCKPIDEDCNDPSNPRCSNYDPCFGKNETSATFYMYESPISNFVLPFWLDIKWTLLDTDTSTVRSLVFKAQQENAIEYEWWIGTEANPRFGREIQVDFGSSKAPKLIRLIVTSTPDKNCHPNDDGIDTLDRMLYFIDDFCTDYPLQGKWKGSFKDKPDSTFIFEFGNCRQRSSQLQLSYFSGFDDTLWYFTNVNLSTFRQKWITSKSTWVDPNTGMNIRPSKVRRAFCTLSKHSDSINVLVEYKNSPFEKPYRRNFIGRRK